MLKVEDYGKIRRAARDGMSIREMARTFNHSRYKIRQILQEPQPRPYTRSKPPPAPVLGPFQGHIDAILAADEEAPRKQRHTAMQVYRRLVNEHDYAGGYDQVRRYIGKKRRLRRETFIPPDPRPRSAPRGRLRPHPRRFPRWQAVGAGADHGVVVFQLWLRPGLPQ